MVIAVATAITLSEPIFSFVAPAVRLTSVAVPPPMAVRDSLISSKMMKKIEQI